LPSDLVGRIVRALNCSILFHQFPLDQLDALAPVVARTYGITDFDARTKIRKGWGFLDRNATEEQARQVAEAIGDTAGGVAVIDNAKLRTPTEPRVIIGGEVGEGGVTVKLQSPKEPPRLVNWPELGVVAVGRFSEEIIHREAGGNEQNTKQMMIGLGVFMVTGIPPIGGLSGRGKKKKEEKPVKSSRVITFGRIVTTTGEQFVFGPNHFDFSGLGEKKELNTMTNFRVLIGELARLSSARLNLGARLLLDNQSLSFANYSGLRDFETELLWLVNSSNIASRAT
jgi:hypothetical protein